MKNPVIVLLVKLGWRSPCCHARTSEDNHGHAICLNCGGRLG